MTIEPRRHFVDKDGNYLGIFAGADQPPGGAVEVPRGPAPGELNPWDFKTQTWRTLKSRYCVDAAGNYIGAFMHGAEPPAGAIDVIAPPEDGRQKWLGSAWSAAPAAPKSRVDQLIDALVSAGKITRAQLPPDLQ